MNVSILVPVLVAVVGLLVWWFGPARFQEVGKIAFAVGLFFTVALFSSGHVRLVGP